MKVKIKNREYLVKWKHFKRNDDLENPFTIESTGGTKCLILYLSYADGYIFREAIHVPRVVAEGEVRLFYKDTFNKAIGRKESLTRALADRNLFNKEERTAFWNEYGSTCKFVK